MTKQIRKDEPATQSTKPMDLNYKREKMREMVKGVFHNYEQPGSGISFFFKEFKGDEIQPYSFQDNEVIEIPLGVARHLNKNGWVPVHRHVQDENGVSQKIVVGAKKSRFGFSSMEFIDIEDITPVGMSPQEIIAAEIKARNQNRIIELS